MLTDAVKDLAGKRLALVKGAGPADPKFVTHVVLGGDLDAQRHFKVVPVPNVESGLVQIVRRPPPAQPGHRPGLDHRRRRLAVELGDVVQEGHLGTDLLR